MTTPTARASAPLPRDLALRHDTRVSLRAMTVEDGDALHAFFCTIPAEDLLFLRRDVTNREVIESWVQDVAADRTCTLLAERDGRIVGEASMHRSRTPWSAHVAELRVVLDAEHRRLGLGRALVDAIFLEALGRDVEKLIAEMTTDQHGAIIVFQKLGFQMEGLFREHVRDRTGTKRDLLVMGHAVGSEMQRLQQWGIDGAMQR